MKKVLVFIADGSEEIEALTPVDVLRRAGVEVKLVSVNGKQVTGSHDVLITADEVIENYISEELDGVVIPGGMPGAVWPGSGWSDWCGCCSRSDPAAGREAEKECIGHAHAAV